MTPLLSSVNSVNSAAVVIIIIITAITSPLISGLGSASTIAIISSSKSSTSSTVCGITAGGGENSGAGGIKCYKDGQIITISPNLTYESISGGVDFFCGITSGGLSLLCWDGTTFRPRRIYAGQPIIDLTVGESQVCAIQLNTSFPLCWRFRSPEGPPELRSITSGNGFSCGILKNSSRVKCWGENEIGNIIESQLGNFTMLSLMAGKSHVCGLTKYKSLICRGRNSNGVHLLHDHISVKSFGLALGDNYTCAIQEDGLVICWGRGVDLISSFQLIKNISFESIVASSSDFFCGITTKNLSIICWGLGFESLIRVPLPMIIPGSCVQSSCQECGLYPNSYTLCGGFGNICKRCESLSELPFPVIPLPKPPQPPPSTTKSWRFLVFCLVGSIGGFVGVCTILYIVLKILIKKFWWEYFGDGVEVRDNVRFVPKGDVSGKLRRDQSGSSTKYSESVKYSEKLNPYSLPELIAATNDFSVRNVIGAGSFGSVYKAEIYGRQVAIKKSDCSSLIKKFQERETAFSSELVLLSRVHHKHIVELVGFCEEHDEMILVYEYMRNGSLYDHLHSNRNLKNRGVLNSWKMRIKIALDAAKGIAYLHNYAVPPIIHRDIKSSNILLNENFTAKISDLGLSIKGPDSDQDSISTDAVGTAGYIDPEYYGLKILTAKSDVYGFGVVLLEILTGKRAVFRDDGGCPVTVVEYVRDRILAGGIAQLLDRRVGSPETGEIEAVEVMGFLALSCVSLESKERPSMNEVVAKLERAFYLCEDKNFSSSTHISFSASL